MNNKIMNIDEIVSLIKPLVEKYKIEKVYLFGSYAREEADEEISPKTIDKMGDK